MRYHISTATRMIVRKDAQLSREKRTREVFSSVSITRKKREFCTTQRETVMSRLHRVRGTSETTCD